MGTLPPPEKMKDQKKFVVRVPYAVPVPVEWKPVAPNDGWILSSGTIFLLLILSLCLNCYQCRKGRKSPSVEPVPERYPHGRPGRSSSRGSARSRSKSRSKKDVVDLEDPKSKDQLSCGAQSWSI